VVLIGKRESASVTLSPQSKEAKRRADFEKCSKLASRYRSRVVSLGRPVHVASELMFLKCRLSTRAVQPFMAGGALGNQIQIVVRALLAAQLLVMDLETGNCVYFDSFLEGLKL
jgi:hypothetical protein